MKVATAGLVAASLAYRAAAKDTGTFAVLRFNGDGFLTEGRVDPVVDPGTTSAHLHSIMGGSNFATTLSGDELLDSKCTTAKIANDKSNYWVPSLFFQDPNNGSFTKVPGYYMNVYYFFEATDDDIKPFPPGLKMFVGDPKTRDAPAFGGAINLDASKGAIQPVQWTCPRKSYDLASYPTGSDGSKAGMQDPNNKGAGAGFPLYPCDGYASPLRQDLHFPSCYNPAAGLDAYKTNMAFPTRTSSGKVNCPAGWLHVPHMFYEVYWNTPAFDGLWTPDGVSQPFVLSNGDATGYSSHADFVAGWDEQTLQTIIDTCDAGDAGMDQCPQIPGGLNTDNNCKIASPIANPDSLLLPMAALPGSNPVTGWGKGGVASGVASGVSSVVSSVASGVSNVASGVVAAASSALVAPAASSVASSVSAQAPTPTTLAQVVTTTSVSQDSAGNVVTVVDVVTVQAWTTVYSAAPTAAAKRDLRRHAHTHARFGRAVHV